jgi:hypothetical protein
LRLFRLRRVDHHHQQVAELREVARELGLGLAKREAVGEHLVRVGAHAEVPGRVEAGQQCREDTGCDHE